MAKKNLKDFINDDTIDLSLNDLTDVPVKEIAAYPKITKLDLSNNNLSTLNKSFAVSLTHLVKLDLARNQLRELPTNFGLLVNLKYLDLYKNKLENLPLSFANLKDLRWLDLKDNPLESHWQQIAGPCLNSEDCKKAARSVVNVASIMREEVEAEVIRAQARQKQLEENEENEQRELAKRREKQREKKRRRNAAKAAEQHQANAIQNGLVTAVEEIAAVAEEETETPKKMKKLFVFLLKVLLLSSIFLPCIIYSLKFVNEPLYEDITLYLSKKSRIITSNIPGHWRVNIHKTTLKIMNNLRVIAFNISSFLYKTSISSYNFVTNDPRFEIYLNNIINTFLYLYITICNLIYQAFNTISQILSK